MDYTKTCAQCNGKISKDAKICPHCGSHSPHKFLWSDPRTIITFIIIIFLFYMCS